MTQIFHSNYQNIPDELKPLKQWGLFRLVFDEKRGKQTKIPINAITGGAGKSNVPETWVTFDEAMKGLETFRADGLGFYFGNGYMGIDVDDIAQDLDRYKDGDITNNIVHEFMTQTNSYTELSVSGTGIHIILKGTIPGKRRRKKNVEMYQDGRFFAITGDLIGYHNDVAEADITPLYEKYLADKKITQLPTSNYFALNNIQIDEGEVIRKATESKQGKWFEKLLHGDWEDGYSSQSEADIAFANMLAFWTGKDYTMMDAIFRKSGLYRPKWDRKTGKATYGAMTLNRAIADVQDVYKPKREKPKYDFKFITKGKKKQLPPPRSWDDEGNAKRFMDLFGEDVRYSTTNKGWFVYNGKNWEVDTTNEIMKLANLTVETMKKEEQDFSHIEDEKDKEKLKREWLDFIKKSRATNRKKAFIEQVSWEKSVQLDDFDKHDLLMNVQNGYVDLTSGKLFDHEREKLFSQISNFEYTEKIDAPLWENFLSQIFNGDKELIQFMQRALGYSLTGSTKEQVMFVLLGKGRNGKSLLIEVIKEILGTYAKTMQASTIQVKSIANGGAPSSDIARLNGARLVVASEPNEGFRLDEGLIKQMTGGDTITTRFLHANEFEFLPKFKLWLATNHKPIIRGTDDGIWRRILLVPFNVQIPEEKVDTELKFKLLREAEGILNWMVDGALMWQEEGLNPPEVVKKNSQEYRNEMDVLTGFINESGVVERAPSGIIRPAKAYKLYKEWATENTEYLMSSTKFGVEMKKKFKKKIVNGYQYYFGIQEVHDSRLNFIRN